MRILRAEFDFNRRDHQRSDGISRPLGDFALGRLPAMMDEPAFMRRRSANRADQTIPVSRPRSGFRDLGSFVMSLNGNWILNSRSSTAAESAMNAPHRRPGSGRLVYSPIDSLESDRPAPPQRWRVASNVAPRRFAAAAVARSDCFCVGGSSVVGRQSGSGRKRRRCRSCGQELGHLPAKLGIASVRHQTWIARKNRDIPVDVLMKVIQCKMPHTRVQRAQAVL